MRSVTAALIVAAALRLGFGLAYWTGKPLTHDEREYLALGINVAAGRGFTAEVPGEPQDASVQKFGRAPLYPLWLSVVARLDGTRSMPAEVPTTVKIAQSLVGVAGVWLIASIARRAAGDRAAIAAAWLAAIYPPLVWMPAYALSEVLYSTIALASVWALGAATDVRNRNRDADRSTWQVPVAAAGVLAGLGALTRPAMLFFLPLAAVLLVRRSPARRSGVLPAVVFSVAALAVIAPWTARNAAVHGRFVLIASEGGITFWTGNHREARGEGDLAANPHLKVLNQEFRRRHAGLSEEALEPLYYREGLSFIAEDPMRFAGLLARKLWFTIVPLGPSYRLHSSLYFWASVASYLLVLPLAILGWISLSASDRPAALLTLAASSIVVCLVFFPQERFRLPVIDPTLIALAGCWLGTQGRAEFRKLQIGVGPNF
jgi:4-amino-4-deoxy-L-arabinose transferase-like glycosyltransferase